MTTQKWQNIGAGPIQCKRFNEALSKLNWENNTYVELTGVIGQSERRSVLTTMCGEGEREDVTAAKESLGERFAWTVTAQNVNEIIKAAGEILEILQQNRPVHDNRTTPTADAEKKAEYARVVAEQKAKGDQTAAAFIKHYGSGEKVTIQPGQLAVVARVCFDNSDTMTDYFDRHASLSQSFVLLVVSKQAETERLARRAVAVSSLLSAMEFDWHTEKYSMGHGNYLESKRGFELPEELQNLCERYGSGSGVTRAHWEITFQNSYRAGDVLDAIAGYGQASAESSPSQGSAPVPSVTAVTISDNAEKDGIEIRFPSKPRAEVLDSLKANGWRWSRFSECWYTKRTDEARRFAEALGGKAAEGEKIAENEPDPPTKPASRHEAIPDDVLDVLRQANFDSDSVQLNGQLDRDLYLKVNKTLEMVGGKWNRGRKCHVFAQNPREVLGIEEGRVKPEGMSGEAITHAVEQGTQGKVIANLFPTPAPLAARMIEIARLEPWQRLLEPSAGTGNILRAVPAFVDKVAIEIDPRLFRSLLNSGGSGLHVIEGDFLEQNGNLGKFDRVVMNPPFERGVDIKHIRHALTFLKPGGRLVALCANGSKQRKELKPLAEESGGWWEDLPAGAFSEQGTGVSVALVVIEG